MTRDGKILGEIRAMRESAGDPVGLALDVTKVPRLLRSLATEAEVLGTCDDGMVVAIARKLPGAYVGGLASRLAEVDEPLDEYLRSGAEKGRREWSAFHGLREVVHCAFPNPAPNEPPASEDPWDPMPLHGQLSRLFGSAKPMVRHPEELGRVIPSEIVAAVVDVRYRLSSPILALEQSKVPPALRSLMHEAELFGVSDRRVAHAIEACLPSGYARGLAARIARVDKAIAELTRAAGYGDDIATAFREMRAVVTEARERAGKGR